MSQALMAEPHAPCTKPLAPCTEPYAPNTEPLAPSTEPLAPSTEPLAPCAMHACKSSLVLKISPKLASGLVPRYGPLIVPCLVKDVQFDLRIIKRFTICFLNNELNDNDYYYRLCYIQISHKECDY